MSASLTREPPGSAMPYAIGNAIADGEPHTTPPVGDLCDPTCTATVLESAQVVSTQVVSAPVVSAPVVLAPAPKQARNVKVVPIPPVFNVGRIHWDPLDNGTYGHVYKLESAKYPVAVAVKLMELKDKALGAREHELIRSVQAHPNIVQLRGDFGFDDRFCWYPMELADSTVKSWIAVNGAAPELIVKDTIQGISSALKFIWDLGLVHTDIKPANITLFGAALTPKLIDFGSAKRIPDVGTVLSKDYYGTFRWMAPEHARLSHLSETTDPFALAMVGLYMFNNGQHGHDGNKNQGLLIKAETDPSVAKETLNTYRRRSFQGLETAISKPGRRFFEAMIDFDEGKRLQHAEVVVHPWFVGEPTPAPEVVPVPAEAVIIPGEGVALPVEAAVVPDEVVAGPIPRGKKRKADLPPPREKIPRACKQGKYTR